MEAKRIKEEAKERLGKKQRGYLPFKRLLDIVFSFLALLLLSPLFLLLSIIVTIDTKGFPIFRQRRIGRGDKPFLILKFRSMHAKTPKDVPTHLLDHPERYITKTGKWMRKTSLDELPQLFNILLGDMSFLGPRPSLWNQEDLIKGRDEQGVYLIRPGLSGYAQTHGRDEIDIKTKVALDAYYLENFSFMMDAKIFFLSIKKALLRENVLEGKQG